MNLRCGPSDLGARNIMGGKDDTLGLDFDDFAHAHAGGRRDFELLSYTRTQNSGEMLSFFSQKKGLVA